MKSVRLHLSMAIGRRLVDHMRSAPEQIMFLRGTRTSDRATFELTECLPITREDRNADLLHIDLSDSERQRVLSWAMGGGDLVVEAHSHGRLGDPACFSVIDLEGLRQWVPHAQWRLGGRPYAALVFGYSTFDGLAWLGEPSPKRVSRLEIGTETIAATGRTPRSRAQLDRDASA